MWLVCGCMLGVWNVCVVCSLGRRRVVVVFVVGVVPLLMMVMRMAISALAVVVL